ncbi:MAG: hypothetical protein ABW175_09425 [Bradyrhizobium sp.]
MQKSIEFRGAALAGHRSGQPAEAAAGATAVPSVERISALVESLSHTLECIKTLNGVIPAGQMRDKLEIECANLVKALAVARDAAMRARTGEAGAATAGKPIVSIVRRG